MNKVKNAFKNVFKFKRNILSSLQLKQFCNGEKSFCNGTVISNSQKENRNLNVLTFLSIENTILSNSSDKKGRYKISPFGEFKNFDDENNEWIQKVDIDSGNALKNNLSNAISNIKRIIGFGTAVPIHYGHPDEESFSNGILHQDKTVYGEVISIELEKDGIFANVNWKDEFSRLPNGLQISPRWRFEKIEDKICRPVQLISLGLTNSPNIKGTSFVNSTKNKNMNKEMLIILGFTEDEAQKYLDGGADAITEKDIIDKLKTLAGNKTVADDSIASLSSDLENEKKKCLANHQKFIAERKARSEMILENCINSGKLTESEKSDKLNTLCNAINFEKECAILNSLPIKIKVESRKISNSSSILSNARDDFKRKVKLLEVEGLPYTEAWTQARKNNADLYERAFPTKN